MCGIAGFVGPRNTDLLRRMGELVRHRGPDQDGIYEQDGCSFVHKRLSIIDLSDAGRQPMLSADGRFVIAYNGEVYNYRELRKKYQAEGWTFRTQTDTECFLASAALHGLGDLDQFHGIFAFALWDAKENVCFIARDRMGIKPLFVTTQNGRVGFASEIRPLLELQPKWKLDEAARSSYLAVGYVPRPRTMFEGLSSLEPGRLFTVEGGKIVERLRFDAPRKVEPVTGRGDAVTRLQKTVDDGVKAQLVSDRPVGVFLSGGLDSTVVLSAMRGAVPSGAIKTFTTRFRHRSDDPKFNRDADLARHTAEKYGCDHHEVEIGPEDLIHEAPMLAKHLGQPSANVSAVAVDAAARRAAKDVTVVLSGDGGDESFGGYDRYRAIAAFARPLSSAPLRSILRTLTSFHPRSKSWHDLLSADDEASRLLSFHAPSFARRQSLFGTAVNDALLVQDWQRLLSAVATTDPVSRFMELDRLTWLQDDAFVRSDRMTMRHGLELRVPLTDDTIVAFAASLPRSYHVNAFTTKQLWRDAFNERCLPDVIAEPKRGWIPPAAKWLRNGITDWARELLEEAIATQSWINGPALRQAFEDHLASRVYGLRELWTVIGYQLWWREYKDFISL